MKTLPLKDIITLGLLNFALYVGAGNIIFPPYIGLMAGDNIWVSALGFFLTGVGLPVITAIAMGRMNGSITKIASPLGHQLAVLVIVLCYLCAGPIGALPRAATVAHDLSVLPFVHSKTIATIYYVLFFLCATVAALFPHKLFEIVGQFLTPVKVLALIILCATTFTIPLGLTNAPSGPYAVAPFSEGLVQGYLTMDTFASLIFSIILVNAIHSRGVTCSSLTTRYVIYAAVIAGIGLMSIYLCLFRLGGISIDIAAGSTNGAHVLSSYIVYYFGFAGKILVAFLVTIACLVAVIGVTNSASLYFSKLTGYSYKTFVWISGFISMLIANLGLTRLIDLSVPVLQAIYPIFILLIALSFLNNHMKTPKLIALPACTLGFLFGLADALKTLKIHSDFFSLAQKFPLEHFGLAWVIPCAFVIVICYMIDMLWMPKKMKTA